MSRNQVAVWRGWKTEHNWNCRGFPPGVFSSANPQIRAGNVNKPRQDNVEEMSRSDGKRLIKEAQGGNADAFAEAFEPLRQFVFVVACRLVGVDDAEDVVMDTYLKAWQALSRFRQGSSLKTWLYRIARNCSLDHIRKLRRRKEVSMDSDDETRGQHEIPDAQQPTAAELVTRKETAGIVQRGLGMLGDEHRITLQLRYSDGLAYSEIAAATGVSIGTVMSRLFNGKRKLKKLFQAEVEL